MTTARLCIVGLSILVLAACGGGGRGGNAGPSTATPPSPLVPTATPTPTPLAQQCYCGQGQGQPVECLNGGVPIHCAPDDSSQCFFCPSGMFPTCVGPPQQQQPACAPF